MRLAPKLALLAAALAWPSGLARAQRGLDIRADNTARYVNGRYEWTVFLTGDESLLKRVKLVEYTLHPSFPKPVMSVRERGGKCAFALTSNSWGEFNVKVKVVFDDGGYINGDHWLNLLQKIREGKGNECSDVKGKAKPVSPKPLPRATRRTR